MSERDCVVSMDDSNDLEQLLDTPLISPAFLSFVYVFRVVCLLSVYVVAF